MKGFALRLVLKQRHYENSEMAYSAAIQLSAIIIHQIFLLAHNWSRSHYTIFNVRKTRKKLESQMGFEPTTLHDLDTD